MSKDWSLVIDENKLKCLLGEIKERFGCELVWHTKLSPPSSDRGDVTTHGFLDFEVPTSDELKQEIRRWVESEGWQFSRQFVECSLSAGRPIEYIYLAPMIPVALDVGYHATRRVLLESIRQDGLLPSTPERQTTERADCEGNIYVCEQLGTPTDAGVRGSKSAHWWCDRLAKKNRFNDPDWVILRVEVGKVAGLRAYRDIWSESGVIVDGVARIPPELVRLEYPI